MIINDFEWDIADNSDERKEYYKVITPEGNMFIKYYKPSIAKLIEKRLGVKTEIITGS